MAQSKPDGRVAELETRLAELERVIGLVKQHGPIKSMIAQQAQLDAMRARVQAAVEARAAWRALPTAVDRLTALRKMPATDRDELLRSLKEPELVALCRELPPANREYVLGRIEPVIRTKVRVALVADEDLPRVVRLLPARGVVRATVPDHRWRDADGVEYVDPGMTVENDGAWVLLGADLEARVERDANLRASIQGHPGARGQQLASKATIRLEDLDPASARAWLVAEVLADRLQVPA